MGQSISSVVEDLQQNAEKEKLANDAMNSLIDLAKMQVEAFELAIRNTNDTQMIPIDKILEKDHIIQCNINNDPSKIGDMISDIFSSFVSGDILSGVSKLINNGLKILLGSYSGNSSTRDTYAITCGDLGGISRIDMHFYSYRYTSSQLTDIAKQVLCVSIVRSSVDPTKLSDATLRNIVQNTYSSSSVEDQTKMYNQLSAARDADLQSRSMNSPPAPAPSLKSFVAMANKYTHPAMKLAMNGVDGAAPPEKGFTKHTRTFAVTLQMNTADRNVESLKNWIEGNLYASLGAFIIQNGMTVVAQTDVQSNSNSVIVGHATLLMTPAPSSDLDQDFYDQLNAALKGAVSDKCPIPALHYTIDGIIPGGDPDPLNPDPPNPDPPNPGPSNPEDEEDLADEDFSDVEEIVKEYESVQPPKVSKLKGVSKLVQSGPVGWQRLQTGRELAWNPPIDCRCERNDAWTQFYLYPKFTNRQVPQLVQELFQPHGSHIHFSMTVTNDLYELDSVVFTVRAPADITTGDTPVPQQLNLQYKRWFHFVPADQIPGTMNDSKLVHASWFWRNERTTNPAISDVFDRLDNDLVAWEAYLAEWATLEKNMVKVLDKMFGQGGWHL